MNGKKEMTRRGSLDSLGYSLDCGGSLLKPRDFRMRRGSEGMKVRSLDDANLEILNKSLLRNSSTRIIEEEEANHIEGLLNHSSFRNHKKIFHKIFPEISEMEDLINAFTCALRKEVLYHGKMYVSQQHVCFYSSVLLKETKVQIHTSTIKIIKKKNTARVLPNGISIITNTGEKYLFGSLRNRDACFNVLNTVCPQLQDVSARGSPQISSAENSHDVDTISSYSSHEDSGGDSQQVSDSRHNKKINSNGTHSSSDSVETRNSSTSWNSTSGDGQSSEESTAVSWVAMVTEKIRSLLFVGGSTNVNKLVIVYLILVMILLLSSGYIGLRIAALEEQLNTMGGTTLAYRDRIRKHNALPA